LRSIVEGRSIDAATVQRSRLDTARGLAAHLDAVVVLKGLGTVVATPSGEVWIATEGSSVLATAGTGDVLAGLVGTLLAQGVSATRAACAGVLVHAVAGACAGAELAERGEGAPTASDVAARLGEAAAGLEGPDADQWMVHLPRQRWG
ncbi:MAG: ADP-dependent NAD(P)H-hydrate dehydratase, partial [Nannocystaceae bacterium]